MVVRYAYKCELWSEQCKERRGDTGMGGAKMRMRANINNKARHSHSHSHPFSHLYFVAGSPSIER